MMDRYFWYEARGAVVMGVLGAGALVYADNWAKKIFGFLIAAGCALYDFNRIREKHKRKQERRLSSVDRGDA